jgi:hypothetical protein
LGGGWSSAQGLVEQTISPKSIQHCLGNFAGALNGAGAFYLLVDL